MFIFNWCYYINLRFTNCINNRFRNIYFCSVNTNFFRFRNIYRNV